MAGQNSTQPSNTPDVGSTGESLPKPLPWLPLLNTLALLATAGFFYYSKLIYKRPAITETGERERLAKMHASPTPAPMPAFISFDPITVNIKTNPGQPLPAEGTPSQIQGKLHYATVAFSLEIRDSSQQDLIENIRPLILDKLIQTLGKKQFHELTTVQGRYILMSELVDSTNHFVSTHSTAPLKEPLVTHAYFTQFIVQ